MTDVPDWHIFAPSEVPDDEVLATRELFGVEYRTIRTVWGRIKEGDRFDSPRESEGRVEALEDFGECRWDDRPGSVMVRQVGRMPGFFIAEHENRVVTIERQVVVTPYSGL